MKVTVKHAGYQTSMQSSIGHPFPPSMDGLKKIMMDFISKYWTLNRSPVNPDTDKLIDGIKKEIPEGSIIEAQSGSDCLTWIVPQRWKVRHAMIKDVAGNTIADYKNSPLHLWMHSVGFKGIVGREELFKHIISDPSRPDEFRFHYRNSFKYGVREWGFSLPHNIASAMTDDQYHVDISAELDDNGTIKVFNAFLPGKIKDTILFMAHTCHPGQVSDGLANIAVLIELYRHLKALKNRKYSYRFLFGPEFFAAAAYLEKASAAEIKNIKYGVYCDMLSSHEPIGFQTSFKGDTLIDAVVENVMDSHSNFVIKRGYRQLWGNDETFFNGPGYEIPMAGIGRGMHREYHYNTDNLENADSYHLVESLWILERITEVFETDFVPILKYSGTLYQSRYGLYIDPTKDQNAADIMEASQIMMDGTRSIMDIARELNADYFFIRDFAKKMLELKLIVKK